MLKNSFLNICSFLIHRTYPTFISHIASQNQNGTAALFTTLRPLFSVGSAPYESMTLRALPAFPSSRKNFTLFCSFVSSGRFLRLGRRTDGIGRLKCLIHIFVYSLLSFVTYRADAFLKDRQDFILPLIYFIILNSTSPKMNQVSSNSKVKTRPPPLQLFPAEQPFHDETAISINESPFPGYVEHDSHDDHHEFDVEFEGTLMGLLNEDELLPFNIHTAASLGNTASVRHLIER